MNYDLKNEILNNVHDLITLNKKMSRLKNNLRSFLRELGAPDFLLLGSVSFSGDVLSILEHSTYNSKYYPEKTYLRIFVDLNTLQTTFQYLNEDCFPTTELTPIQELKGF